MARTRWPPGPGNPGLLPRPGRSDRQRRWVPQKPGPGRQIDSQDSPSGVSRFGGQAGTQATDPTPPPDQSQGGRAGSTTHILPADYALLVDGKFAAAERCRTTGYVLAITTGTGPASPPAMTARPGRPGQRSAQRAGSAAEGARWCDQRVFPGSAANLMNPQVRYPAMGLKRYGVSAL